LEDIADCTTYLEPTPAGSAEPYIAVPGRKTFEEGIFPGADFLDLQGEFSDRHAKLRFMMPAPRSSRRRSAVTARDGTRVVLYSIGT
jgi:thiosulfate/3-mercaptopyruvate sulfurtransferase